LKTYVYVDGFNLYYGCLKGTLYRWLDLEAFCRMLVPSHSVERIKYFTAQVKTPPGFDGGSAVRQGVYLRAVAQMNSVETHLGHYQSHPVMAPLVPKPASGSPLVRVLKTEEKGSDVNLAAHLLLDAFRNTFEQAIVVSNDADLATPIRRVKEDIRKPIGVVYPCTNVGRTKSVRLKEVATFVREVRVNALAQCQLPNKLTDAKGDFSKPKSW
jgi:hypothetical protein